MRRITHSLDGDWDFHFCGDGRVPLADVAEWRRCPVPAPWQAVFDDLRERNGRAWYRRSFDVPAGWLNAAVVVRFGAVNYHARVLVNGHAAVEHEGGYLPFEADIAHLLHPGRNEIAVEVAAPTDDPEAFPEFPFAEIPFGKQSWYGPLGGIWQSVTLERRAHDHIRALRLVPDARNGAVAVTVALARPLSVRHELELEVEGPDGAAVASLAEAAAEGVSTVCATIAVAEPLLWSPDAPHLYRLTATLRRDDGMVDTASDAFGFRTVEARDGRIVLNGEPIHLRAALDQDYYPDRICTAPSLAFIEDQFRKAKELGLNGVRCHIKAPDPRYYEAADRIGLLIWTETPNVGRLTAKAAARLEATLRGVLERDGNHPSIICWTIINENWGTDLVHDAGHRAWVNRTYQWLKRADPTRLVVDNSPLAPSIHVESDLIDYHFYAHLPDHRSAWDGFVERLASGGEWTHTPHGDANRRGDEPLLCSEFGNWGLPDPAKLRKPDGSEPWWFETGHDWGEGVMLPHGVERRFRACGLDRVFGSFGAFAEAAQWQQYHALKYQIEAMRRQPALAGYVITELTDCHWEANGLMDMERNTRVFHSAFAAINADTVVVPAWSRTVYWAGERVEIGLTAAHGRGDTVTGVELRWSLDAAGLGGAEPMALAPGVTHGRPAVFEAPDVAAPELHQLEFELDTDERVLATNHLDIVVHPRRQGPPVPASVWSPEEELRPRFRALGYSMADDAASAAVIVARRLTEETCALVREGARLVLLADSPQELEPVFPHWQAVRVVKREGTVWMGSWASSFSWLRRNGPFARLPGGPLLDHSFDRVIPDHVIVGCNTFDFQSRVHGGLVVGWVHKAVALVVEREYGHGRMVASTFRLLQDAPGADPTATALLDGLVELALSERRAVPAETERVSA